MGFRGLRTGESLGLSLIYFESGLTVREHDIEVASLRFLLLFSKFLLDHEQ